MALTTILAAGTTAALSDPIVIASGVTVNVALQAASTFANVSGLEFIFT